MALALLGAFAGLCGVLAPAAGAASTRDLPPAPSAARCAQVQAPRTLPVIESYDPQPHAPRVFAIQYRQDLANLSTYDSFRVKLECLIRADVLPRLAPDRPNVVVLNEDIGLATIAIGSRGAAARQLFGHPGSPSCESQGAPCATLAALGAITAAYAPQIAAYHARFAGLASVSQAFVGATDTIVHGFMGTLSGLALRYGIYVIGSADLAPFTQSTSATDIDEFADPDEPRPASVYVASAPEVYNTALIWGPADVRSDGPDVLRNVVASNRKVPLTPIENELQFTPGPSTGPAIENLRPFTLPGTHARLGIATSLPAFVYGSPAPGVDPCTDTSRYYMRCLDELGANLVIQDEANPGRWTGPDGDGVEMWQPLSWMSSTYRTVSDPSVHFDYNVTAMMVGNLADLPFDGQSAITQRGGTRGPGCHYIGNGAFLPGQDEAAYAAYAGNQPDFLAIAPWVVPDGSRDNLRAVGAQLAPGSGAPSEDDYAETAIAADLPIPPDPARAGCASAPVPTSGTVPGAGAGPRSVAGPVAVAGPGPSRGTGARQRCRSRREVLITLSAAVMRRLRTGGRLVVSVSGQVVSGPRVGRRRVRVDLRGRPAGRVTVRLAASRGTAVVRRYRLCVAGPRRRPVKSPT